MPTFEVTVESVTRQTFEVTVETVVVIEVDECLTPDDEWRSVFYDYHTLADMAEHIVWNRVVRRFEGQVEGILPEDEDKFKIVSVEREIVEGMTEGMPLGIEDGVSDE